MHKTFVHCIDILKDLLTYYTCLNFYREVSPIVFTYLNINKDSCSTLRIDRIIAEIEMISSIKAA